MNTRAVGADVPFAWVLGDEVYGSDYRPRIDFEQRALTASRPDEARRYFQDALDANPESAGTYIAFTEFDVKTERTEAANAVLLKGVRIVTPALKSPYAAQRDGCAEKLSTGSELAQYGGQCPTPARRAGEASSTFKDLVDAAPELASGGYGLGKAYLMQFTAEILDSGRSTWQRRR